MILIWTVAPNVAPNTALSPIIRRGNQTASKARKGRTLAAHQSRDAYANCHMRFQWRGQKLRGHEPDRLDSPQFPGLRYVARALRQARRGLPVNDLPTEAARGGRLAPSGARTL